LVQDAVKAQLNIAPVFNISRLAQFPKGDRQTLAGTGQQGIVVSTQRPQSKK
jgi:hypothetical protein